MATTPSCWKTRATMPWFVAITNASRASLGLAALLPRPKDALNDPCDPPLCPQRAAARPGAHRRLDRTRQPRPGPGLWRRRAVGAPARPPPGARRGRRTG
ncbi:hypothetical protein G6F35_016908 [Rhizopus arrhizus]|nr:hypothetical protein G6F31_020219 [Rhizopus arrhizus]KAG1172198.1 hypothetical protein G6F35_016908 [Rhizopus arrhizus]